MSVDILLLAAAYLDRRERESEHGYACSSRLVLHGGHSSTGRRRTTSASSVTAARNRKRTLSATCIRSTHNELEKNRRAELRHCIERLKQVVPVGPDSTRHTTQRLLGKACHHIQSLQDMLAEQTETRIRLMRVQLGLRNRLRQLQSSTFDNEDGNVADRVSSPASAHPAAAAAASQTSSLSSVAKTMTRTQRDRRWRQRAAGSESRCSTSSDVSNASSMSSLSSTSETELVDVVGGLDVGVWNSVDSGCDLLAVSPVTSSSGIAVFDD